jgi:predicted TPR repeat methyltransferase
MTARDPLASSDLIAQRRFAYGNAFADEGDWAAAAEMFEQTLEQAPGWAAAWFALAEARERLGDLEGAAAAFRATLAADPSDAQGAGPRLALLGDGQPATALPQAYVARLFDDYAPRFEAHLIGDLNYRGPALIAEALEAAAPGRRFAAALDLGCGTGLMGEAVRDRVDRLTGVDLSPAMIARARGRALYDGLEVAEATAFVLACPPGGFDLILAADAFCYFGDLTPILTGCGRALAPTGLVACSIETTADHRFQLRTTMRFAHDPGGLDRMAAEAGLRPLVMHSASTRREGGADVPGLILVFQKTDA